MGHRSLRLMLLLSICLAVEAGPPGKSLAQQPPRNRAAQTGAVVGYPVAWGANQNGQLGNGRCCFPSSVPAPVRGLTRVVAIGGGRGYSMALKDDGTVWEWGCCDEHGQPRLLPVQVRGLTGVVALAAGGVRRHALRRDGTVWTWTQSRPVPAQVSGLSNVTAVAAGENFSLALRADGTVWAWGDNSAGELGTGTNKSWSWRPIQLPGLSRVTRIAAGEFTALALERDGTVWSWGDNSDGQLGRSIDRADPCLEIEQCASIPGQVRGLAGVTAIAADSFALRFDGTVWAWGGNTPRRVRGLNGVVSIASGPGYILALKRDGMIWAWGNNSSGQLGRPCQPSWFCPGERPERVQGLRGVIAGNPGWDQSFAILRSPIPVPKQPMCAGSPSLATGQRFPRTVRLNAPQAIAVSEQTGQVFVLNGTGYDCQPSLTILDARTAAPRRVVPISQDPYGEDPYTVLVADQLGRVFVVRRGNRVFQRKDSVSVLDTRSGRLLYSTAVAQDSQSIAVDQRTWRVFILHQKPAGPAIADGNAIYLSTLAVTRGAVLRTVRAGTLGNTETPKAVVDERTGRLFVLADRLVMLDARDGQLLHTDITVDQPAEAAVVEATGRVLVLSGSVLHVLDARTGAVLRSVDNMSGDLVVDERAGVVLVLRAPGADGARTGTLLNARDGSILRRFIPLGYGTQDFLPPLSAVDGRTGSIYLFTRLDRAERHPGIVELDPKRGKIVRTIPLLHRPSALAVAGWARRIFVVDSQAGTVTMFRVEP